MKVEKTVIVGHPAISRALLHRAPSVSTPARAKPNSCHGNASVCGMDFCGRQENRHAAYSLMIWPPLTPTTLPQKNNGTLRFRYLDAAKTQTSSFANFFRPTPPNPVYFMIFPLTYGNPRPPTPVFL